MCVCIERERESVRVNPNFSSLIMFVFVFLAHRICVRRRVPRAVEGVRVNVELD